MKDDRPDEKMRAVQKMLLISQLVLAILEIIEKIKRLISQ